MAAGSYLHTVNPDLVEGSGVSCLDANYKVFIFVCLTLVGVDKASLVLEGARELNDDQLFLTSTGALDQDIRPILLTKLTRYLTWVLRVGVKSGKVSPQYE